MADPTQTLKLWLTIQDPAETLERLNKDLIRFAQVYNTERPHASLPGHVPPAQCYRPAIRPYPSRLPALLYPNAHEVRLVDSSGTIKWRNTPFFPSSNLTGAYVGLTHTPADLVTVAYGALALGELDPHHLRFIPHVRWVG